jgi:RNA polymerase sigma-70 factor (ECF subfamily)
LDERDLISLATSGNEQAFEALVRPYLDVAFRTAWIIARDTADAEDAVQTAIIKAHRAIGTFRPDEPFRPWLLRIVANEARNAVRSRVRRRSEPLPDDGAEIAIADDPLAEVEARERSAWLVDHINHLDPIDRTVLYCRYALDLSEREMAAVLDCAPGTVKSRLHRAQLRLRARIETEGKEDEP